MDEEQLEIESKEAEEKLGSGAILAAARKEQNFTVEHIAQELNLGVAQIRAIELDQSEGLPEPTYVRGYIRSYAKLLGLESKDVLSHYLNHDWQQGYSLDELPRGLASVTEREGSDGTARAIVFLIALALAFAAIYFFTDWLKLEPQTNQSVSPTFIEGGDFSVSEQSQLQLQQSTGSAVADEISVDQDEVQSEGIKEPSSIESLQLELDFSDTSWLDIRDSDGERLAYQSFVEGDKLELNSNKTLNVFIGTASSVSVKVNGEDFDLQPHLEGVFARFSLSAGE